VKIHCYVKKSAFSYSEPEEEHIGRRREGKGREEWKEGRIAEKERSGEGVESVRTDIPLSMSIAAISATAY
jgi:sensor histidine kinase regulating citrate/malate metabolism